MLRPTLRQPVPRQPRQDPGTGGAFLSRTDLVLDGVEPIDDRPNEADVVGVLSRRKEFGNVDRVAFQGSREKSFLGRASLPAWRSSSSASKVGPRTGDGTRRETA